MPCYIWNDKKHVGVTLARLWTRIFCLNCYTDLSPHQNSALNSQGNRVSASATAGSVLSSVGEASVLLLCPKETFLCIEFNAKLLGKIEKNMWI